MWCRTQRPACRASASNWTLCFIARCATVSDAKGAGLDQPRVGIADYLISTFCASVFELLLERFGIGLRQESLRLTVFGAPSTTSWLLQAEAGGSTHHLDDLDFLVAGRQQHDVEFGLRLRLHHRHPEQPRHRGSGKPKLLSNAFTRSFRSMTVIAPTASRMSSLEIAISNYSNSILSKKSFRQRASSRLFGGAASVQAKPVTGACITQQLGEQLFAARDRGKCLAPESLSSTLPA